MDINKLFSDMAQRSYEFAEMCSRGAKGEFSPATHPSVIEGAIKHFKKTWPELIRDLPDCPSPVAKDPEAWREDNRKKQAAGVKFKCFDEGEWHSGHSNCIYRVKPKTAKHYFALYKMANGYFATIDNSSEGWVMAWITDNGGTIIGNIETREVEVTNG